MCGVYMTHVVSLTIAVDTLELGELRSWAAVHVVVRDTLLQPEQAPAVAAGLLAGDGLHQVRAAAHAPRGVVGDRALPQLEPWTEDSMAIWADNQTDRWTETQGSGQTERQTLGHPECCLMFSLSSFFFVHCYL